MTLKTGSLPRGQHQLWKDCDPELLQNGPGQQRVQQFNHALALRTRLIARKKPPQLLDGRERGFPVVLEPKTSRCTREIPGLTDLTVTVGSGSASPYSLFPSHPPCG